MFNWIIVVRVLPLHDEHGLASRLRADEVTFQDVGHRERLRHPRRTDGSGAAGGATGSSACCTGGGAAVTTDAACSVTSTSCTCPGRTRHLAFERDDLVAAEAQAIGARLQSRKIHLPACVCLSLAVCGAGTATSIAWSVSPRRSVTVIAIPLRVFAGCARRVGCAGRGAAGVAPVAARAWARAPGRMPRRPQSTAS